jgi:hypothetical protein
LLLQHFLPVRGGQFPPELGGQFPAESVVSLHRNQVVNISEFSKLASTPFCTYSRNASLGSVYIPLVMIEMISPPISFWDSFM